MKFLSQTNVGGLHKEQWIQTHEAQDQMTRTGKLSQTTDERSYSVRTKTKYLEHNNL